MFTYKKKDIVVYIILIVAVYVLFLIKDVLTPFIIGLVLAFAFKNITYKLEKKHRLNRQLVAMGITLLFWTATIITFIYLVPFLLTQTIGMGEDIFDFFNTNGDLLNTKINEVLKYIGIKVNLKQTMISIFKETDNLFMKSITNIFSTTMAILNTLYIFIISPVTMYYLLNDWNYITGFFKKYIPFFETKKSQMLFVGIESVLNACIKEQFYVCLILGLLYGILLSITGLNYGFLVGLLSGFATFIPYIGIIIGMVIGIIMTIYQYGFIASNIILTISIFLAGLLFEMNFLLPKFVGQKINLHPMWVIFSMVAGGALWGFYGLLLALPIAGVIGVLLRFYLRK